MIFFTTSSTLKAISSSPKQLYHLHEVQTVFNNVMYESPNFASLDVQDMFFCGTVFYICLLYWPVWKYHAILTMELVALCY